MSEIWLSIIEYSSATMLGVVASVFSLLVFHKIISPRIEFSSHIQNSIVPSLNRHSYLVKIKKRGLIDLIDTRVVCRLAIRDINRTGTKIWNYYSVPTTFEDSLRITSRRRIIRLKLHSMKELQEPKSLIARNTKPARQDVGYRFEDFFMQYDKVYIEIQILGHDAFTGVKKLYLSPRYRISDIRAGKWNGMRLKVDFQSSYA